MCRSRASSATRPVGQPADVAVAIHKSTKSTGRRSAAPPLIRGAQRRRPVGPRGVVDGGTHHADDSQSRSEARVLRSSPSVSLADRSRHLKNLGVSPIEYRDHAQRCVSTVQMLISPAASCTSARPSSGRIAWFPSTRRRWLPCAYTPGVERRRSQHRRTPRSL